MKAQLISKRFLAGALLALALAAFFIGGCASSPQRPTRLPGYVNPSATDNMIGDSRSRAEMAPQDEELWIITRKKEGRARISDDLPGTGSLMTRLSAEEKEIPLPLKHTSVKASVAGYIATVDVVQQFQNPYDGKIEALYVFPLPENAAITEFVMRIGERRIRGIIRDRKEAEQIYRDARQQGYVASLLTEERPNIFTQHVANIEPGHEIDVQIRYFNTLAFVDGWHEFVFPMVVAPRYNPSGSTTGIGATPSGQGGRSGQPVEVQYLKPNERSGHEIDLQVDLEAGVQIEDIVCRSHEISRAKVSGQRTTVALAPQDRIPNRDFVLRYKVAGAQMKSSLFTFEDERGGFFSLMLYPPAAHNVLERQAMEMIFVLDSSGSMNGEPIEQAKSAIARGLERLQPEDTFQIINFSMHASKLGSGPIPATPANVQRGLKYLASLHGEGGTEMITGIKAALDFPHDARRLRFVSFLTDGLIGNEADILKAVQERIGSSRIFSFGVGSAPNRYLLDRMAKLGRGAVAYLSQKDDGGQVMDDFFARISRPAMTDIEVDWGGWQVSETYPRRVPDLFSGRPVILTGRFQGRPSEMLRIKGRQGGETVSLVVPAARALSKEEHPGLPSVWARMKIADLADRSIYQGGNMFPHEIKRLALDYSLMSAYTAFVAVDSTRRTEGREGTTVPVPVPVPKGQKYETSVH